jgi:hypothetical protein
VDGVQHCRAEVSLAFLIPSTLLLIVNSTATNLGFQSVRPFDWTVDRTCDTGTVHIPPINLRHSLMIQKFCHRMETIVPAGMLDVTRHQEERSLLLRMLEKDLDELAWQIRNQSSSKSGGASFTFGSNLWGDSDVL